jgi:hypothetical protein
MKLLARKIFIVAPLVAVFIMAGVVGLPNITHAAPPVITDFYAISPSDLTNNIESGDSVTFQLKASDADSVIDTVNFRSGDGTGITKRGNLTVPTFTYTYRNTTNAVKNFTPSVSVTDSDGETVDSIKNYSKFNLIVKVNPAKVAAPGDTIPPQSNYTVKNPPQKIPVGNLADVQALISQIIGIMQAILFSVAGIFVVLAGYYYLTAQGDPEKTTNARNMITYAAIAIGIGILATILKNVVVSFLGAGQT